MRSRTAIVREFATYVLLAYVPLQFVVFNNVGRLDMADAAVLSFALAVVVGYLVFEYSLTQIPGRSSTR